MKKTLMLLASVAMLASACSNDKEEGGAGLGNTLKGIDFKATVNKTNVRVTDTDIDNLNEFTIYGRWDKEESGVDYDFTFMKVKVEQQADDSWEYSPVQYWPESGKVDFYGFSPSTALTHFAQTETDPVITYTVPTPSAAAIADSQIDLVVTGAPGKTGGLVNLTFKHALSQVVFQAKAEAIGLKYEIESISMPNLYVTGDCDLSDLSAGWETASTDNGDTEFPVYLNSAADLIEYVDENDEFVDISKNFVILPQVITPGKPAAGQTYLADVNYLKVEYKVTGPGCPAGTQTAYLPITGVDSNEFLMGKRYIFRLSLGADKLPILFDVEEVEDWDDTNVGLGL